MFWRLAFLFLLLSLGYLAVIDRLSTSCSGSQKLQPEVRKISLLKTSPEVGKITSLNTSPKETTLVKKYCEIGKNHLDGKDKSQGNNLAKNSECLAS